VTSTTGPGWSVARPAQSEYIAPMSDCTLRADSPLVVAIDMGYGHLRPAHAVAELLGAEVFEADRPPLAGDDERRSWARTRSLYGGVSRTSQLPFIGKPLRALLEAVTAIPSPYPRRDLSNPTFGTRMLQRHIERGLGAGLVARLRETGAPLVTTFYAPALAAAHPRSERVFCIVTDTDVNRVWVPTRPREGRIHYLVPSHRARRRLATYGVPKEDIELTGYPLPHALLGGPELPVLRATLRERLVRLDPRGSFRRELGRDVDHFLGGLPDRASGAPLLTFAVGGVGAQAGLVETFLPGLAPLVRRERLRIALVAGVREDVRERLVAAVSAADLASHPGVEILFEPTFPAYLAAFNALLARTDILWTKPSEMTFFGALGLPLVFSWPVGDHERYNRRWAVEQGVGLRQHDPRFAGEWLREWLKDGTLAAAAWSGFMRLPKFGLYRIVEAITRTPAPLAPPSEPPGPGTLLP
jgi:hypothetical protein